MDNWNPTHYQGSYPQQDALPMSGYLAPQGAPSPCKLYQCIRWSKSTIGRRLPGSLKGGSEITGNYQEISMEVEIPGNIGKRCRAGLRRG